MVSSPSTVKPQALSDFGSSISTDGNGSPFSGSACKTSEISFQLSLDERTTVFMGFFRPQRLPDRGDFARFGHVLLLCACVEPESTL